MVFKVGTQEIDFIAQSSGNRAYYQVSARILDPTTFEREVFHWKKYKIIILTSVLAWMSFQ